MQSNAVITLLAVIVAGGVAFVLFPRPDSSSPALPNFFTSEGGTILGDSTAGEQQLQTPTAVSRAFCAEFIQLGSPSENASSFSRLQSYLSEDLLQQLPETQVTMVTALQTALELVFFPQACEVVEVQETNQTATVALEFIYTDRTTVGRNISLRLQETGWKISGLRE